MRVPPTEKRGRVQTSSVSVAVVDELNVSTVINKKDVEVFYTRGSGAGGQHRNKVETCVTLHHKPSGIRVMCQDSRSKIKNEEIAWTELKRRIDELETYKAESKISNDRKSQIGTGGRLKKTKDV